MHICVTKNIFSNESWRKVQLSMKFWYLEKGGKEFFLQNYTEVLVNLIVLKNLKQNIEIIFLLELKKKINLNISYTLFEFYFTFLRNKKPFLRYLMNFCKFRRIFKNFAIYHYSGKNLNKKILKFLRGRY